jgi:hypothetical protein
MDEYDHGGTAVDSTEVFKKLGSNSNVPVDYKSARKSGPVSIKKLKSLIDEAEYDILKLTYTVRDMKRELTAIIEEIGENW